MDATVGDGGESFDGVLLPEQRREINRLAFNLSARSEDTLVNELRWMVNKLESRLSEEKEANAKLGEALAGKGQEAGNEEVTYDSGMGVASVRGRRSNNGRHHRSRSGGGSSSHSY